MSDLNGGSAGKYTKAIWQISQTFQSAQTVREALTASLRIIGRVIGAEEGSFWYLNGTDNRIYPIATLGDGTSLAGMSLSYGEGIAGDVIKTGQLTFVPDCEKDARFAHRFDAESGFKTRSMICAPLAGSERVIGCIQIINKLDGSLFSDDDAKLCLDLAHIAVIALEDFQFSLSIRKHEQPILKLRNAYMEYGGAESRAKVLKGVNLDVFEGEMLVVLGESGNALTALFNILGGLEPITGGVFSYKNADYSHATERELAQYRRATVGHIFRTDRLLPALTARENVLMARRLIKNAISAEAALEAAQLSDKADSYPARMTPGQRQRLSIARALVKKPDFLLADDPTARLDYGSSIEVLSTLETLSKGGLTTVILTQNREIARMANRALKLSDGVIADATTNGNPISAGELTW